MSLYQKSILFLTFFFPVFSCPSFEVIQLTRLNNPDEKSIVAEREKADARIVKKYVVTTTALLASLAAIWVLYQVREAAYEHDKEQAKKSITLEDVKSCLKKHKLDVAPQGFFAPRFFLNSTGNSAPAIAPQPDGLLSRAAASAKSFSFGTARFFADSAFSLVSGAVLYGFYNYTCDKVKQVYVDETVLWYAHEQTQIPHLLNDLKLYATDYDLFASLLSAELFNQDATMHFKSFVKDLVGSAQSFMNNDVFKDPAYFDFLLEGMKKKYVKKGQEMEKLSDYVVPAIAKRNRVIADEHASLLFGNDMNRRADIAKMCNLLVSEMSKLTAFVAFSGGLRQQARICDMIDSCNKFVAHMEMLLNSTPEQLLALSKSDCGMFTSVYEYEKLFGEQIHFLHRYCKLTN